MPTRLSRRLRRRLDTISASGDAGITLMELLVSMVLSTILGAMTLGLFVNINTSTADTTDRGINTSSARNAIQAWTAYLRVADGFTVKDGTISVGSRINRIEWLTADDMLFYADLGNRPTDTDAQIDETLPPTMIWLRLDSADALVEEQFASTATLNSAPQVCRTLATGVSAPTALFTANDHSGTSMSSLDLGSAPTPPSKGCQPLPVTPPSQGHPDAAAQANLQNVYSVTIDFVIRDTRKAHPLEFFSQAVLPALGVR